MCACHVFAIDGYRDSKLAETANQTYEGLIPADKVVAAAENGRGPNWNATTQLKWIVDTVRSKTKRTLSDEQIKIFGGFRKNQLQPEHMWVEYKGWIYDTMPGRSLHAVPSTRKSRKCPYLEGSEFAEAPYYQTLATKAQLDNIDKLANKHKPSD